MKTVIFDLDYTLFDAKAFRDECLAPFFGLSPASFEAAYQKNKMANGNFDHLKMLADFGLSEEALDAHLEAGINRFFYQGTEKLVKAYRQQTEDLILATFGNVEWQKKKIKFLKIGGQSLEEIFDEIIIEDKDKSSNEFLNALKGMEVEIINDNDAESRRLVEFLGDKANLRLMKGPYSAEGYQDLAELGRAVFPEEYYNEYKFKIA